MKKALVLLVLVVVGLLAYSYFTTGKFTLIPSWSLSEEEREIKDLESQFDTARERFKGAGRAAALSGVDTTADAEAARLSVDQVEKALKRLKNRLDSESARREADRLEREIQEFKKELG